MRPIKSEFAQCCDDFFRAAGCTFAEPTGPEDRVSSPGELLEVLAPLAHARAAVPDAQSVLDSIRLRRNDIDCSTQFVRGFSSVWRLLGPPCDGHEGPDILATSRQNACGAMRVFCDLMRKTSSLSDALDLALQVLEGVECVAEPRPAMKAVPPPASPQSYEVFLSYSTKDDEIVTKLKRLLKVVATAIFQDKDSIPPGASWREVLSDALAESSVVVVFWTCNSIQSIEVTREWVTARRFGKRVVPVLLDSTLLDPLLADYQAVDLRPTPRTGGQGGAMEWNQREISGAALKILEAIIVEP